MTTPVAMVGPVDKSSVTGPAVPSPISVVCPVNASVGPVGALVGPVGAAVGPVVAPVVCS